MVFTRWKINFLTNLRHSVFSCLQWVLLAVQWTVRTVHWVVCSLRQPLRVYEKCDWDTKLLICCVICFLKRSTLRVCITPCLQHCSKSSSPEHCTSKHDSSVPVGWTQDNDTHKHTIAHIVLLYNKRKVYTHCIIPFLKRSAALRVCSTSGKISSTEHCTSARTNHDFLWISCAL